MVFQDSWSVMTGGLSTQVSLYIQVHVGRNRCGQHSAYIQPLSRVVALSYKRQTAIQYKTT